MGALSAKIAFTTGCGSGIGRATAIKIGAAGAKVLVTDINEQSAVAVAKEITDAGGDAIAFRVDVREESHFAAATAFAAKRFGGVDLAFNNAANTGYEFTAQDAGVLSMDLDCWDQTFAASLRGVMLACKHVIPEMLKRGGGAIVNTSSQASITGHDALTAYSSAKAGINQLTRQVATQFGYRNIRCNAVAPGLILTPATRANFPKQALQELTEDMLIPDFGTPEDIADIVLFLLSGNSRLITGQVIGADGGAFYHAPRHGKGRAFTNTGGDR